MPQFESEYEEKLYHDRLVSLEKIAAIGQRLGLSAAEATYPNSFRFTHTIPAARNAGASLSTEDLEAQRIELAVAGRLMAHRSQGKAGFAQLQGAGWAEADGVTRPTDSAERLQIYVRKDDVGEDVFELYKLLQLGDIIGVRGILMRTRTGELTLKALPLAGQPAISFLAKATLALPDKYHGLEDVELRYRQRYVDLIMNSGTLAKAEVTEKVGDETPPPGTSAVTDTALPNEEHNDAPRNVREVFVKRNAILRAIRRFFDDRGYLEVETPMMQPIAGGAAARPFKTHHNALDIPLSLRIAPELYLKRLVVGGLDRVYEINRNFRNEGVSTQHNPEFTMLEFYQAYANYHDLMDLTQELITQVAQEVNGTTITHFNGHDIDLGKWQKLSMREAIIKFWPKNMGGKPTECDLATEESFRLWSKSYEFIKVPSHGTDDELESPRQLLASKIRGIFAMLRLEGDQHPDNQVLSLTDPVGKQIATLFEVLAEQHLIQPTIIYDFPLAVSPLSKVKPDEPDWVERFEFYIGGFEVGNAFSELNDPADQQRRFEAQLLERDRGDDEAHAMDEDYVRALGYGMPPTAGEGIGIDRLTMLLTGSRSIRDVILFPLMRPLGKDAPSESEEHTRGESAE